MAPPPTLWNWFRAARCMPCWDSPPSASTPSHHQAIRELAPSLAVMATSPDGLIESICLPGSRFAWGVQWHPEHMAPEDANSVKIFEAFVEACID